MGGAMFTLPRGRVLMAWRRGHRHTYVSAKRRCWSGAAGAAFFVAGGGIRMRLTDTCTCRLTGMVSCQLYKWRRNFLNRLATTARRLRIGR